MLISVRHSPYSVNDVYIVICSCLWYHNFICEALDLFYCAFSLCHCLYIYFIVDDPDDKRFWDILSNRHHRLHYTTYCPNRPHTNTNLEPGATIDSYSVNRSLTTVILLPDFCLKTAIDHTSSSFSLSRLPLVAYCFIVSYSRV